MQNSPLTVQQWIDNLPSSNQNSNRPKPTFGSPTKLLPRELSIQSDTGSSCSSVESVLELRKPDPEEVLLGLGFGPPKNSNMVSKIPARFLQPSKLLSQIDIDEFLEQYGVTKYTEHCSTPPATPTRPKTT